MAKLKTEDEAALRKLCANHRTGQPEGDTAARLVKAGLATRALGVYVPTDKGRKAVAGEAPAPAADGE